MPSAIDEFRAAQGAITSPYAVPGQVLQVRVRPQVCDTASLGLGTAPSCVDPSTLRVTVLFAPGGDAPVNAVVLARSCGDAADPGSLRSRVDAWAAALAPRGTATCIASDASALDVAAVDLTTVQECRLNFRFPAATGTGLALPDTLTGATKIVVEPISAPLPTGLASTRCADAVAGGSSIACIDELYRRDGSCATEARNVDARFASFTALPVPNDFKAMLATSRPALRFALDGAGNLLAPIDWSGVLCQTDPSCSYSGFPPPKIVEVDFPSSIGSGLSASGADAPSGVPLAIPGADFASSQTLQGKELPPLLDPSTAASASGPGLKLFGSTDAIQTVIRLQLVAPGRCSVDQRPCTRDSGCAQDTVAQTCNVDAPDVTLANLRYCAHPNACAAPGQSVVPSPRSGGPGLIPASLYAASTDGFVPLDTLNVCRESDALTCVMRDEAIDEDQNGDGDAVDPSVLTLRDRRSGDLLPVGLDGTGHGLATALLHEGPSHAGPFGEPVLTPPYAASARPAVTARGDCAATLFAEPWENGAGLAGTDANHDGEAFSPILRVFCRDGAGGVSEVAAPAAQSAGLGAGLAASPAPLLLESPRTRSTLQGGGEPIVLAGDSVYVLLDEAANTVKNTQRADVDDAGRPGDGVAGSPTISPTGSVVCFESTANLVGTGGSTTGRVDIYCHDFDSGTTDVVSRFQTPANAGNRCTTSSARANGTSHAPSVSADGSRVCYESLASNLLGPNGDRNGKLDVFVNDRRTCETVRASTRANGAELATQSRDCHIAASGDAVAFASAGKLVSGDVDDAWDVYVRPVQGGGSVPLGVGTPVLVSGGIAGDCDSPSISADGSRVVFECRPPSGEESDDRVVVVRELSGGVVSDPLGFDLAGSHPRLSADGNVLTLESRNPETGAVETAVVDLGASLARRDAILFPAALNSTLVDIGAESYDGSAASRGVAFTSGDPVTPLDSPGAGPAVHVRDLVTRLVKRVGDGTFTPALSDDASAVAYVTSPDAASAVYRRGPDPAAGGDVDGNGSSHDLVLAVLDLTARPPAFDVVGAARRAAIAGTTVAYTTPDGAVMVRACGAAGPCAPASLASPGPARDIAASEQAVCVVLESNGHVACAPIAGSSLVDLGVGGSALAVSGDLVIFTTAEVPSVLRVFALRGGTFAPVFQSGPGVRRFVVGESGHVAYDRCEADAGVDLNGDGVEDECVLNVFDPATAKSVYSGATVLPCTLEACDRRFPWRVFPSGAAGTSARVRFLSLECQEDGDCSACAAGCAPAGRACDLNANGSCRDVVVRELDLASGKLALLATVSPDTTSDPLAGFGSGGVFNDGALFPALVGRCDVDRDPATTPTSISCRSDADCPLGLVCGPPYSLLALNDEDGDGVFDGNDDCPEVFDPGQEDGDGDGIGDACDACVGLTCPKTNAEACGNLVDDDADGAVDCADTDCSCPAVSRVSGTIRDRAQGNDLLELKSTLDPAVPFDAATQALAFRLSNAHGLLAQVSLPPGKLARQGKTVFRFRDPAATRARSGLVLAEARVRQGRVTVRWRFYGDLSGATLPAMTTQIVVGGESFVDRDATWRKVATGWRR